MAISSVSSINYSSTFIQQSSLLFSASQGSEAASQVLESSRQRDDHQSDRHHEERDHHARGGREARGHDRLEKLSDLREILKSRGDDHDGDDDHGEGDDFDTSALQQFSYSSFSVAIEFSSILQLQSVAPDTGPAQSSTSAPATSTATDPEPVAAAAPVPQAPATPPAPAPAPPATEAAFPALPGISDDLTASIESAIQALTQFLESEGIGLYNGNGTGTYQSSFQFELEATSLSYTANADGSYEASLTSLSLSFSQDTSLSFTDGSQSFAKTDFALAVEQYSAAVSTQAFSNQLVSNLLAQQNSLFA